MMKVDIEKCIGCGLCVKDCFPGDIKMVSDKAKIRNIACFKCGHCIAVCPANAISTDEYNMDEIKEYSKEKFDIDPENLLNFIKFRRSIRQFKTIDVAKDKLEAIIEAGRFTQTGANAQDVSYTVVRENLAEIKELTYETLNHIGEQILSNPSPENQAYTRYAKMWINMYKKYKENPVENDKLFCNAPAIIITTAFSDVNAALASSNMELMANSLTLGTFFSGFFVRAASANPEIRDIVGIPEGKHIVTCMTVGYPDVQYKRSVPRKAAEVSWK
ncbi:nitroreductase family protein [Proteocatella sphenisci]|uniref:nitroreductase family protein n=1 Tax=Proteocatella sphenisci TaxID=181070 RepID=UPI0004913D2D|nr:nitroreductase family protein [Proteocatella sphenisci]